MTAWEALYERRRLEPKENVLIHAGAGGVGHVAIQLAKLKGANVATTVGSEDKANFVKQLGADQVIFYKQTDFAQAAKAHQLLESGSITGKIVLLISNE